MALEHAVALLALGWLVGALLLLGRSIRLGRSLAESLATRHPDEYEDLGRPRPGWLQSLRRDRFAQFVARRAYERLQDPVLASEFEAYRKAEARLVIALIASLLVVFVLVMAVRRFE